MKATNGSENKFGAARVVARLRFGGRKAKGWPIEGDPNKRFNLEMLRKLAKQKFLASGPCAMRCGG